MIRGRKATLSYPCFVVSLPRFYKIMKKHYNIYRTLVLQILERRRHIANHFMKKEIHTHPIFGTDKMVITTISEKNGKIRIVGRVRLCSGQVLTSYPPCTRTAENRGMVSAKEVEVVNHLTAEVNHREKSPARAKAAPARDAHSLSEAALAIQKAFLAVKQYSPQELSKSWGKSTAASAVKYFERNILPFLLKYALEAEYTETTLLLREQIKRVFTTYTDETDENAMANTLKIHLMQSEVIYRAMDLTSDTPLPRFDFSADHIRHSRKEQFKAFPQEIRLKIVAYLHQLAKEKPLLAKRFVAMFDAGLRTGEACAVRFDEIRECCTPLGTRYGVYQVTEQEDPRNRRHRTAILKTESAYRTVIFSAWGMQLLRECNADEPTDGLLPVTQGELCRGFLQMLEDIGITRADMTCYWDEAQRVEAVGQEVSRSSITDYIMRRDRASRWKNLCGLSSADIDMLLGHRTSSNSRYERSNKRKRFALKENLDRLAELNENYAYDNRGLPCILLRDAEAAPLTLPPCLGQEIHNNSDGPMTIRFSGHTVEPGDELILRTPAEPHVICGDAAGSTTSCPAIGTI